jgi:hypothetical protein
MGDPLEGQRWTDDFFHISSTKRLKSKVGWAGLGMDHHDADQLIDALMGN